MKKNIITVMALSAAALAAQAEPGFIRAEFTAPNMQFDGASDIWTADGQTVVTAISDLYTFTIPEHTTYAYAAYMWMEGNSVYYFRGQCDDYFSVKIGNVLVINKATSECKEGSGGIAIEESGWRKIELRASNNAGDGGANPSYAFGGIWYRKGADGDFVKFADSGDGSLFRTDEPEGYEEMQDSASDFEFSLSPDGSSLTLVSANVEGKIVTIPTEYCGIPVTGIGANCFQNNTTVMKVVIPETVTSIGNYAFDGCLALTSVNIPSGVTAIGSYTFRGCAALRSVVLPDGLTSIGGYAFQNCSSLASVDLPDGLTSIGSRVFGGTALTAIEIPDSVTSLNTYVFNGCLKLEEAKLPAGLTAVPDGLFSGCSSLKSVTIPDGVTSIVSMAFYNCSSLKEVVVPAGVNSLGSSAFSGVGRVIFLGRPPAGLPGANIASAVYPKEYGALWRAQFEVAKMGGYVHPDKPVVTIVSTEVRANNPTVLDVVYKVTSTKPTVKVRALAFEDGERTLSKVTRPETFIDGTAANLGDAVAANVEHTLSWQVSSDFHTDLAKMKFEVLAVEDDILPLELVKIPANGDNRAMLLSWNALTESQYFDALLWLYADGDTGLKLEGGILKRASDDYILAFGASVSKWNGRGYVNIPELGSGYAYYNFAFVPEYIFSKMGFSVLSGDELTYANEMTRLGLTSDGLRQFAYKWLAE